MSARQRQSNSGGGISRRRALGWIGGGVAGAALATALLLKSSDCGQGVATDQGRPILFGETRTPPDFERQGFVNDASGLNLTRPAMIISPAGVDEVRAALAEARRRQLSVTAAGSRHCMGGQALQTGALLLDMRQMAAMSYHPDTQLLRVQPGATWAAIQRFLDPLGRAVRVMQSSNIFTVGGSLSVNAHGRDVRFAPLVESIESLDVMLADGQVLHASLAEHDDLFRHVIGGYGLLGVVVQVELKTTDNEVYEHSVIRLTSRDFVNYYGQRIVAEAGAHAFPTARLMEARLSIDPDSLFDDVLLIENVKVDASLAGRPLHQGEECLSIQAQRLAFLEVGTQVPVGKKVLWWLEQNVEPRLTSALATRNQVMSPPIEFLRSASRTETQVLQEFFLPRPGLLPFIRALRQIVARHQVNVIHANLRTIRPDRITALPYAQDDGLALVLYVDQPMSPDATEQQRFDQKDAEFTRDAADAALAVGGTFYLPYRLFFTHQQVLRAYPGIRSFFATKRRYDPDILFANSISQSYGRI